MHKFLHRITIMGCLASSLALLPLMAIAQQRPIVKFYCGQSFDPDSNQILPTTLIASSARKEPVAFIQWKSTDFGEFTPQKRCDIVSPKLQQAWKNRRLDYLMAGVSPQTGQGIICGASKKTKCDRSNMLFTLDSGSDASAVIKRIRSIQWGKNSNPISQGSGNETVDMQKLVEELSKS
jgi:Circadian oscillating protein COP23